MVRRAFVYAALVVLSLLIWYLAGWLTLRAYKLGEL